MIANKINEETINSILGTKETFQAPTKMLEIVLDETKRESVFNQFLEVEFDLTYEWFQSYFEKSQSERKEKKQDFTPMEVARIATALANVLVNPKHYFEAAGGTGGIMVSQWSSNVRRDKDYDTKAYWYQMEELSEAALPFLLFNMSIRGMNGVVLHGDSLNRVFKNIYFIRNMGDRQFSEIIIMPKNEEVEKHFDVRRWE